MADLYERLIETRAGYVDESKWLQFLRDAYSGGGGFAGDIAPPLDGWWGAAATMYQGGVPGMAQTRRSYLSRHPREDAEKFTRRRDRAHYPRVVEALTRLKVSSTLRKPARVDALPDDIEAWRDVAGGNASLSALRATAALRAAVVGWTPAIVDLDQADGLRSRADLRLAGIAPRVTLLAPEQVLDWEADDAGRLAWCKIRVDRSERPDPLADARELSTVTIWHPDHWQRWSIEDRAVIAQDEGGHPFGEVPLAVLRHSPALEDPVRGLPMHGGESLEARALFDYQSWLDEELSSAAFSVLVMPGSDASRDDDISIGPKNALEVPSDATVRPYYLEPSGAAATALENRIDKTVRGMYRSARVEFAREGSAPSSGTARAYEFAQLNRALVSYAEQIAAWDARIYRLAGRAMGLGQSALDAVTVTPPTDFDIDDVAASLKRIESTLALDVGPRASADLRLDAIKLARPGVHPDVLALYEAELDAIARSQAAAAQYDAFGAQGFDGQQAAE